MATAWDVVSSLLALAVFLGVVYGATKLAAALSSSTATTKSSLSSKGVTYANGRLSVKTDTPAPSREAYIAQTQQAFERGARVMSEHRDAFKVGARADEAAAGSTALDADKKGFKRTRKLA